MLVDYVMIFAIDAAVNGVDQPVSLAAAGMLEKRATKDPFPFGSKDNVHWVVHAAGHDRLDRRAVGSSTEDV